MAAQNTPSKLRCCVCGQELPKSNFLQSKSLLYTGIARMPICSSCLDRQYKLYRDKYSSNKKATQRVCMAFDIYFNEDIFDEVISKKEDYTFVDYLKKLSRSGLNSNNYDTTINEGKIFIGNETPDFLKDEEEEEIIKVPKNLIDFWGGDYAPEEYEILQNHYDKLVKDNPDRTSQQEIFIQELCDLELMKRKAKKMGATKEFGELCKVYRDTFSQANLSVTKSLDSSEFDTLGNFIAQVQKYCPAEYYQDKKRYSDFDGFSEYWQRFVFRPLKNLCCGTKERDKEYFVPEDD